jgi:hypothetical protein
MKSSPGVDHPTNAKLAELAVATGRTEQDLVDEGVGRLYRIYLGDPPAETDAATAPFSKKFSERAAEVVVRQVTPANFTLREPFKYVDRDRRFDVPEHDVSDFASVPGFLTWLVPRYGRHSLAALLHDHLQDHLYKPGTPVPDDAEAVTSEEADTIFRQAMQYSRVPFVRRWVMWAAVALRTVFLSGTAGKVAVVAWALLFGVLGLAWPTAVLISLGTDQVGWQVPLLLFAAAVLLPVVLCWVALRRWRLTLISGLTLSMIAFPCVQALITGGIYYVIERIAMGLGREKNDVIVQPQGRTRSP